jgi:hypothetical protein
MYIYGATTLRMTTQGMLTLNMTLSIMFFSKVAGATIFRITTLSLTKFSITTLSIKGLFVTLNIYDIQDNMLYTQYYAKWCCSLLVCYANRVSLYVCLCSCVSICLTVCLSICLKILTKDEHCNLFCESIKTIETRFYMIDHEKIKITLGPVS